jgi:uncharacterized protein YfbU (UPF0304 family)
MPVSLSELERLMLSNQYRILEALYPDERQSFALTREAIEHGYELEYAEIFEQLYEPMSEDVCERVVDILNMHRALHHAWQNINTTNLDPQDIKFRGFDGNHETRDMVYTRYLLKDCGKWQELHQPGHDYNSHMQTAGSYERMIRAWRQSVNKHVLTRVDVERIIAAVPHP